MEEFVQLGSANNAGNTEGNSLKGGDDSNNNNGGIYLEASEKPEDYMGKHMGTT